MAWLTLVLAGVLEVGWAVGMTYTEGFKKPVPTVLTVLALVLSFVLLERAQRDIPIGTAYAVWVGIGVVGAAVYGTLFFDEPMSLLRGLFLCMLVGSIIGLKFSAG